MIIKEEVVIVNLLEFKDVSYVNEDKTILKNISVNINSGDFISIVGPSGSGKSTFLKLCCHLISPSSGEILFKGEDFMKQNPIELRKSIGYCFQMPYLFGNTVYDNIAFPYNIRNLKINLARAQELLISFNLDSKILKEEIKNLSGGEKQRIALIRMLLLKPEVILLDEVTSALDVNNTFIVEKMMNLLNKQGITILWITHNLEQSKKYANKLLRIENGEIKSLEVLR